VYVRSLLRQPPLALHPHHFVCCACALILIISLVIQVVARRSYELLRWLLLPAHDSFSHCPIPIAIQIQCQDDSRSLGRLSHSICRSFPFPFTAVCLSSLTSFARVLYIHAISVSQRIFCVLINRSSSSRTLYPISAEFISVQLLSPFAYRRWSVIRSESSVLRVSVLQ
jgi:hypothetical protein